jgi:hypothetical protein
MLAIAACAGALLSASAAGATGNSADQCAALDYLLAQARTEFPALKHSKMDPQRCSLIRREYRCQWAFPGDRFDAAKEQGVRLTECIAAAHGAEPLKTGRDEAAFQLNPETSVYVRGPEMVSGEWTLTLRIVSTAD